MTGRSRFVTWNTVAGLLGVGFLVATTQGAVGVAVDAAAQSVPAAAPLRGVWTAEPSKWRVEKGGTATLVRLSLRRVGARGDWNSSETVPVSELAGLTADAIDAPSTDVRFEWRRDAGSFSCEGRFLAGAGAGHFTFKANPAYVADLRSRGYGAIDDEKALTLAIHDVSRAFLGELAALGYERLPMDKLIALRIHGASAEHIRGLAGLGYGKLPVDQIVAFRIHGASLEFIRSVHGLGFTGLPPDAVVSFRIHGVSPEFVKELKALGYSSPAVEDLVSLRIHGVTPDFIRAAQGRSGKGVTLDRLVSMRIHGEGPE
jgi:hypothetical protein